MYPEVGERWSVGFKDESVGVIPDSDDVFGEVNNQFFSAIREKSLYFGGLVNLDISQEYFIFDIPDLELFNCMSNKQMIAEWDLQQVVVDDESTGFDLK